MQQKLMESPNPWKAAMEEACIVNWCPFYENDPVKTLHSIVSQDIMFALDPRISSDAQKLVDYGMALAHFQVARQLSPTAVLAEPLGPWMENIGKDETHQPCQVSAEDMDVLVEYCGDSPETFDTALDIVRMLAKHGYVRCTGRHTQPLARLVIDMLCETMPPSLQESTRTKQSDSDS